MLKTSKKKDPEGRPLRVYAAILALVIVIAVFLYFNRDTPIPKEIKDAVSTEKTTDSVWTLNNANRISLKTPDGNIFILEKDQEKIKEFSINGKVLSQAKA
ncbi:MAG: hypothetical protein J7578_20490, partial [Chitinophagaceae bacterium]|nr:hypothetical protein [Chitinophagaceae bacterium]